MTPRTRPKDAVAKETLPDAGSRSLRLRLLLTVIVALVPAAFVNIIQGVDRVQQDMSAAHDRLIQMARTTASDAENVVTSAEQILHAVATEPAVHEAGKGCANSLTNALTGFTYFVNLARVDARGDVVCAVVLPPPEQSNVSDRPWWPEAMQKTAFFVIPQAYSVTAQRTVLAGILPLRNGNNEFDGALAIAWDLSWLDFMLRTKQVPERAKVAIFDAANGMVAANDKVAAADVFRDAKNPEKDTSGLLASTDKNGDAWSYALVPLRGDDIYVAFGMPDAELFNGTFFRVATDLLLPVLMLGLASIAIWFATDRLVLRWIAYLRRIATAYARGHYAIRPVALEEAPSEFRELGETFSGMAAAVQDRDRRLREALDQKSLLIKEIHHRVKNNLQIVMSLLSLQANQLRDPAAQNALRQAQVRVNALALVHRILHEIENLETVDLKRLLEDLVRQIHEGFGANKRDLRLEVEIARRQVTSEIAVPLTLLTVEVLTNAFKHAYPQPSAGGVIRISLLPIGDNRLRLSIEDDGAGMEPRNEPGGVGSRLIQAFAQQIGGTVTITPRNGGGTAVSIVFPDPLFTEEFAEAETG
jgi:two-component sensor histidine kinase